MVSAPARRVRSRRSSAPVVAVTGAASGVGHALAARLAGEEGVRKVVAVDDRRGDLQGVVWRVLDVCDPALGERLADVDVVVHTLLPGTVGRGPAGRGSPVVRSAQTVLTAGAAAGVRRVVLVSSGMVYGALPDNPVPLDEDGPLRAVPDGEHVGELLELERLAARAPRVHPGLAVTVLRPAVLVGPGVDTVFTRHFESPRLLVVRDSRPRWQFCHVDDLVSALEYAALGRAEGVLTVACEGWLDQADVERISGRHRIELPAALAFGTAERLHRLGIIPAAASELQYVVHPWVLPATRLRASGWRPAYDNVTALQVLLDEVAGHHAVGARRIGRRDAATVGAAGAAVAALGTAALIRRTRRRRRSR